jgi:putative amide transporter protein
MVGVALMFTGAVLLANGLALMGQVEARSCAAINLFVGGLDLVVALQAGFTGDTFTMGKVLLFGFTYLWLAYNSLMRVEDARAFGWYCAVVAVLAFPTAAITFSDGSEWFGAFWLIWGALWLLFFVMLGLGIKGMDMFAGLVTVAIGVGTALVPGYLMVAGKWAG